MNPQTRKPLLIDRNEQNPYTESIRKQAEIIAQLKNLAMSYANLRNQNLQIQLDVGIKMRNVSFKELTVRIKSS